MNLKSYLQVTKIKRKKKLARNTQKLTDQLFNYKKRRKESINKVSSILNLCRKFI